MTAKLLRHIGRRRLIDAGGQSDLYLNGR